MDPTFKIGHLVTFELCREMTPRWDFGTDNTGIGIWSTGVVQYVDSIGHEITVKSHATGIYWRWPTKGNPDYSKNLQDRPGYLRHTGRYSASIGKQVEIVFNGTSIQSR